MGERKSIVIFGGSFNPPHNCHISIAKQALKEYEEIEKIIFVPVTDRYPKDGLIENKHRYNMLKSVAEENNRFVVSDIDMKENETLPTIELLEKMKRQYKDKEIWVLMGSDNLKIIHQWDRAEELISEYKYLIMERNQDIMEEIIKKNKILTLYKENFKKLKTVFERNLSSTYIRELIISNKSIKEYVPDEVSKYIEKNKLYERNE